jgi:VIT1/CCC1 family predicted Fe2+/Mn2+ transporter
VLTPSRPVYGTRDIAIATLLGGPFAGGLLVALTLQRLHKPAAAVAVLLGGLALALLTVSLGERLQAPYGVLPALTTVVLAALAHVALGPTIRRAESEGTPVGSLYGMGVASLMGIAVMMAWAAAT